MSQEELDFAGVDYINQTQDAEYEEHKDLKQPNHFVNKVDHKGQKVTKAIQKQKSNVQPPVQQKKPVPPQFLKNKQKPKQTPAQPKLAQTLQKKNNKRNKRQWKNTYQIQQITSLVPLSQQQSSTKRYKIQFTYGDSATRKTHNASLRFGKRDANYVIDGCNSHSQALLKQAQIRKAQDPFCPNYWCLWLLNNPQCPTLQESLAYYRKQNNIY